MKQYATVEFYRETYQGSYGEKDLDHKLQFATLKIDRLTFNRIKSLEALSEFQKERVMLANCYQADYEINNGSADTSSPMRTSYSAVDISESFAAPSGNNMALKERGISQEAYSLLQDTGLMYRGC